MLKSIFAVLAVVFVCVSSFSEESLDKLFRERSKSVVNIRFIVEREESRVPIETWGSVASQDGLILIPFSEIAEDRISVLKEFKVFWKGGDVDGAEANYLGCDKRRSVHYIRLKKMSDDLRPLSSFERGERPKIGDEVWGLGIYDESLDWSACIYRSYVNISMDEPFFDSYCYHPVAQIGGAVFDFDGKFVGWGMDEINRFSLISSNANKRESVRLINPSLTDIFISVSEFDRLVKSVPKNPEGDDTGWLGVAGMQILKRDVAKLMGLENKCAIVISDVIEKSPAALAGLSKGDIIVSMDGKDFKRLSSDHRSMSEFRFALLEKNPDETVELDVIRSGTVEVSKISVKLGSSPKTFRQSSFKYFKRLGFSVREFLLDDSINRRIMKSGIDAAVVQFVKQNSPASSALPTPLSGGDIVKEINSKPVSSYAEAVKVLDEIAADKNAKDVVLLVEDFNETKVVRIKLD